MSDYRDVIRTAIEQGFYPDSCGEEERHYTWGAYVDLCGMDPADAVIPYDDEEGGGSGKKKNTITVAMEKDAGGQYDVVLNATYAPTADVIVSFTLDGQAQVVTMPAGTKKLSTGLRGSDPQKPYAEIGGVSVTSEDEQYTYTSKNTVKTGVFTFTMTNNGQKTTEQVKYGTVITLPEATPKEGYDFVWKDGKGNTITASTVTMPESDYSVTGSYVIKSYTLTYTITEQYLDGDNVAERTYKTGTKTFNYNAGITTYLNGLITTRTGMTALGWKDGNNNAPSKMPARDLDVPNKYALNRYTVKFIADGVVLSEEEMYYGATITAPADPTKEGYTFTGWDSTVPATVPARNLTFTARFTVNSYTITYFVDGAEKYTESHNYGTAISIRADESKVGHTFSGWNPSSLPATMPAEDIEVRGTFTVNEYTLTFYVDGSEYDSITDEYDAPVQAPEDPTKVGHTFTGWDKTVPATIPAEDMDFDALFQINRHKVTYYVDGQVYAEQMHDYGDTLVAIADPEREGYTFSGWSGLPATMPDEDVDVLGTFSVNSYTATYKVDGNDYATHTVQYGQAVPVEADPSPVVGYTFSGWDNIPATMPAHDVVINGTFDINSHILKYVLDGSDYSEETVEYGTVLTVKPDPVREGYTFTGWVGLPETMPDEDVTVTGAFQINQYTLTFILDGEPYSSITADYGTSVSIDDPVQEGYSFSGWDSEVPQTMPAEDKTFRGTMSINTYTATFVIDNQTYTAATFQYGASIVYPVVEREGYVLVWDDQYSTMPASDLTIRGHFEEFVESSTVYYGMVLNTEIPSLSGVSELDSYDYETGVEVEKQFITPSSQTYLDLEELWNNDELSDEEFEAWQEAHRYGYLIIHPASATLTSVKDALGIEKLSRFSQVGSTFDINGTTYRKIAWMTEECCTGDEAVYRMRLTFVK